MMVYIHYFHKQCILVLLIKILVWTITTVMEESIALFRNKAIPIINFSYTLQFHLYQYKCKPANNNYYYTSNPYIICN